MRAVLTFHSVDQLRGPLSYPAAALEAMLDALNEAKLPVLSLDDLLASEQRRGVSITFDDGISTVLSAAMPVLRDRKVPAHVFVISRRVGRDNRWPGQPSSATPLKLMSWTELEVLQRANFFIEAHTATHPDLRALPDRGIEDELREADDMIENRLGRLPRYFAYPYGHHDERVRAIAARRYQGCFTTRLDYLHPGAALNALPRLDVHYLRSARLIGKLEGRRARTYIAIRRALRMLRGH